MEADFAVECNGVYFCFCGSRYVVLFLALSPSVSLFFHTFFGCWSLWPSISRL